MLTKLQQALAAKREAWSAFEAHLATSPDLEVSSQWLAEHDSLLAECRRIEREIHALYDQHGEVLMNVAEVAVEFAHKDTAAIVNAPLLLDGRTVVGAWQDEFIAALASLTDPVEEA